VTKLILGHHSALHDAAEASEGLSLKAGKPMSALSHKQTFRTVTAMYALAPKATLDAFSRMSAKGQ
jgi:hypothetical protein